MNGSILYPFLQRHIEGFWCKYNNKFIINVRIIQKSTLFYAILIKNGSFRGLNYLFDVLSNASSVYSAVKRDVFSEGEGT